MSESPFARIPGPPPMPLVGWRGNAARFAWDRLGYMTTLRRRYGDVVALARGGNRNLFSAGDDCPGTVFAFGPPYNQAVLSNLADFHFSTRTSLEQSELQRLGAGIFNMNGATHKRQRRLMLPAFQREQVHAHQPAVVEGVRQTLAGWRPGRRIDLLEEMRQLTLRVACRTLFGVEVFEEAARLGRLIQRCLDLARTPAVLLAPFDWPLTPYRRYLRISRRLDRRLHREILALLERQRRPGAHDEILSQLIRARDADGAGMSEYELRAQANALFIAAHETTASALTWTFFLLAQHPAVTADLLDELTAALHGDAPSAERLDRLPLLERVLKESLRLLPPAAIGGRVAARAVPLGRYELPAGTEVHFSQYHTHHMPELYARPESFRPERWHGLRPSPYEYLPFGAAGRKCIGAPFALMEMKIVLAVVLQSCRLQVRPRARIDRRLGITLLPRGGMPMIVRPQDRRFAHSKAEVRGNVREMVELP